MDDEIQSPHFPAEASTVTGLYQCLRRLQIWVQETWESMRLRDDVEFPPDFQPVSDIPVRSDLDLVAVVDMFRSLRLMQKIRCDWDRVLRNYEDNWDCKPALRRRAEILVFANSVFANSFVSSEQREMLDDKMQKEMTKQQQALNDFIQEGVDRKLAARKSDPENEEEYRGF